MMMMMMMMQNTDQSSVEVTSSRQTARTKAKFFLHQVSEPNIKMAQLSEP
jgi:hypothetical protein